MPQLPLDLPDAQGINKRQHSPIERCGVVMSEIIACPSCQRKVTVPVAYFGKQVQCPECKHTFLARDPSAEAVAPMVWLASEKSHPSDAWDDGSLSKRPRYDDPYEDSIALRRPVMPHRGSTVLTLGVMSIVLFCAPILGPTAWILGHTDLKLIRSGQMDRSGEGMTQAGMILGMVTTILPAAILSLMCLGSILESLHDL